MMKESPIFVTGCPRSGTSIVAAALNKCGAFIGTVSKRSMYENCRIKDELVKPYLQKMGADWKEQYPLTDTKELSIPMDWNNKVEQIMLDEGYNGGKWMYKGSNMTLTWPVWNYAFPNAKWVIVRRKTSDIIESCLKTGYMNAFSDETIRGKVGVETERDGWLWWVREHEKKFVEMITEGLNCKIVWPERMVNGDYHQMFETLEWVGLRWKDDLLSYIDPLLWTSRKKGGQKWQE